jgi:hypothetical protein
MKAVVELSWYAVLSAEIIAGLVVAYAIYCFTGLAAARRQSTSPPHTELPPSLSLKCLLLR